MNALWRHLGVLAGFVLAAIASRAAEPSAAEQAAAARDVLVRWLEVSGGTWRYEQLKTIFYTSRIDLGLGAPPIELVVRGEASGLYRFEYELPRFGQLVQAFDGTVAWEHNQTLGFGFLSRAEHQLNLLSVNFRGPLRVGSNYPERRRLPDETVNGRRLQLLEMHSTSGAVEKWYFDPATGLRVRLETPGPNGPVVIEFDDFRTAFGVQVKEPFLYRRHEGGRTTEVKLSVILYNESMDPGLFSAPQGPTQDNREVELILARNAQIRGAAAIRQVQTRVTHQLQQVQTTGTEVRSKIYQKKPNLFLLEQDTPGMGKSLQGFDGKIGWAWSELEGFRQMEGAELMQLLGSADFEGPIRLSAVCPLRRPLGTREIRGRRARGVALATLQGPVGNFFFDENSYELMQVETLVQTGADGQLAMVADFDDYRRVDGILLPFRTTLTNPAMKIVTTVESVQHDVVLDDAQFAPRRE